MLARVLRLHALLVEQRPITSVALAADLGVSERTIKRDIAFMRDSFGCPIAWQPEAHSYVYTEACDILPLLRLTADEALSLALAGRAFAAWGGSPLGRALTTALGKIATVVGGAVSLPAAAVSQLVFQPDQASAAEAERHYFALLLEAIHRRRELRLSYQKPRAKGAETRVVHPLHLAYLDHEWVLLAHDRGPGATRTFRLSRIRQVHQTGRHFVPPKDFDLQRHLAGSVGRFMGDREWRVVLRVNEAIVPYLEERPWHASQTLTRQDSGSAVVSLRLNNLIDIQRRILACGAHVEVLEPAELRDAVAAETRKMTQLYGTGEAALQAAETPESYSPGRALSSR